ncbi:glycerol kinase [Rhodococcus sp. 14-2470-1b]|uniref:DAK2 domain-containing protein n=1 Tax=Rhodococcus sp. 14-2470-1b TaxID=2023149 RepID=UPI000B9B2119|nr:DAK2 domain-containing protein [Rhodococcus sp. 14-2470-1b]OZF42946.1 glycerol kinase [Rhodococcus sp. 14-2470-1b]
MGEQSGGRIRRPHTELTVDLIKQWAYRCVDGLSDRCDEMNELNVFPIPDSDTGTNLVFTVRSAVECMRTVGADATLSEAAAALARGAVSGARGNSGVIVSQVLRAVAEQCAAGALDGAGVQAALARAAELVLEAVSVPMEGTIVTVLAAASTAAQSRPPGDLEAVASSASEAAASALDATRTQLPALDVAGVVDAGALGLVVMLDALASIVTGTEVTRRRYHRTELGTVRPAPDTTVEPVHRLARPSPGFEVLYSVLGIDDHEVPRLRAALGELGDSVVVAGDGAGSWTAHVHTANAGLAVEAGLRFGQLHNVRIEVLDAGGSHDGSHGTDGEHTGVVRGRDILAVVAGDGAEELYSVEGASVLRCDTAEVGPAELCAAIVGAPHTEVLVLPNGALSAQELVSVSIASRTAGKDVLMLPSSSMVQGLAALAVHNPARAAVDDAYAMSEAAAGTRWASLRIADERSLTWVGTCEPGDGLGLVGHDVVVIGADVITAGKILLDQLLSVGGEMVTMLRGAPGTGDGDGEREPDVVDALAHHVAEHHPGVEVILYTGGQPGDVVQLGVE